MTTDDEDLPAAGGLLDDLDVAVDDLREVLTLGEGKRSSRRVSETTERDRRVLELRRAGLTFDEIARREGFANKGGASKSHKRALARTGGPEMDPDNARELEADRLDRLQAAVWPKAMKGEPIAVEKVLRISRLRIELLGLARAVIAVTPEKPNYGGGDGGEGSVVSEDRLEEMRRARERDVAARTSGTTS